METEESQPEGTQTPRSPPLKSKTMKSRRSNGIKQETDDDSKYVDELVGDLDISSKNALSPTSAFAPEAETPAEYTAEIQSPDENQMDSAGLKLNTSIHNMGSEYYSKIR